MLIYGILSILAVIGAMLLNISADIAIQLSQYNFGDSTARVSWYKDALLSGGVGLIVTVIFILLYNEVIQFKTEKERKFRQSIAAKDIYGAFLMYMVAVLVSLKQTSYFMNQQLDEISFEHYFDDSYYKVIG